MSHYNYCGICQGITLHEYRFENGVRWELCQCELHDIDVLVVTAKLSSIINERTTNVR